MADILVALSSVRGPFQAVAVVNKREWFMTPLHLPSLFSREHFTHDGKLDRNELFGSSLDEERSVLPPQKKLLDSHGVQTLKIVTTHPLSRTHPPSSEAKLDRWGWNEVCQTRQQWSRSKDIPLIKLISAVYYWLLLSSSFGGFVSDAAGIDNGSRCKINDWAGKVLEFD